MRSLLSLFLALLPFSPSAPAGGDDYAVRGWLETAQAAFKAAPESARSLHGAALAEQLGRSGDLDAALGVVARLPSELRHAAWESVGDALLEESRFDAASVLAASLGQLDRPRSEDAAKLLRLRYELLVRCGALAEAEQLFAASQTSLVAAGTPWTTSRARAIAHASSEAAHRSGSIARRVVKSLREADCSEAELAPIEIALMLRALDEGEFVEGAKLLGELGESRRLQDVGAARRAHELLFARELELGQIEAALARAAQFALQYHDNRLLGDVVSQSTGEQAANLAERALEQAQPSDSSGLDRLHLYASAAFARTWNEERSEQLLSSVVTFDTEATLELLEALCAVDREERARELAAGVRDLEIAVDLDSARLALATDNLDRFERRMDSARARVQRDRLWPRLLLAEALVDLDQRHEARIEIDRLYDALSLDTEARLEHIRRLVAIDMDKRGGFGLQLALNRITDPALKLQLTLAAVEALRSGPLP